ncbi:hypothetical protein KFL_001610010 [Klebsormidium nitens]|uniref:Uncharacterized protein n=1 Tax=Klebsormidium nitens TaxID=105231 RepID=A0A1Y1I2X1_KLENI|nr:hypothetical protein KFL_001610010 [Klebsormidium nitens]|eukprot:GAQ83759.1 hypothetical protein KFL_001610010 [Klebsormidium nitens]
MVARISCMGMERKLAVKLRSVAVVLVTYLAVCSARTLPSIPEADGTPLGMRRSLMQDTSACLVQCTPPPSPEGIPGEPYCCPFGSQCLGDGSAGVCEAIGGGGDPIPALILAEPGVSPYATGDPDSGPNPCNFNGNTWYCPETLNCGRAYLDCLPSESFFRLANEGY